MLKILILLPILGTIHISLLNNQKAVKLVGLIYSGLCLLLISLIGLFLNLSLFEGQFVETVNLSSTYGFIIEVDGISYLFVALTSLIQPICILTGWTSVKYRVKEYLSCLLLLQSMLYLVFVVKNLLIFYIFFEAVLIPMFLLIGIWGSRQRKIHASYQFFLYTLAGSLLMLIALMMMYAVAGTFETELLSYVHFSPEFQRLLWLGFFISFAIKVPMIPFHIWLPEAHVEAPTFGSIILAAILLKLGTYGLLRFSIGLFPEASVYYSPLVFILSSLGILYGSLTTIRQIDLKKIIAYSSVAHMGYVTLGLFSLVMEGVTGSIIVMIGHGFVSGALFFCVGALYDRYGSRIITYYGGLVQAMPLLSAFFLLLTLANISFPGTVNFIGEILIIIGIFKINVILAIVAALGTGLGAAYSMWAYNRVFFGKPNSTLLYIDITRRELFIISVFILLILVTGLIPGFINSYIGNSITFLLK